MEQMNERRYACARSCAAERLGAFEAPPLKAAKTTLAGSSDAAVRNAEHGGDRATGGERPLARLGGVKGLSKRDTRDNRCYMVGHAGLKVLRRGLGHPFIVNLAISFSCARRPVGFQNNEGL